MTPTPESLGYISEADRFITDTAAVAKAERDADVAKREQMFYGKRIQRAEKEERRWGTIELQHQLEHCFPTPGSDPDKDKQRYQATLQLKNSQRERLTTHVMLQQEMLQHLDALVSSEVTKSADESSAEPPEAGAASVDTTSDAVDTTAGEVEKAEPSGETAA